MPVVDINGTAVEFPDMPAEHLNAAVAIAARQMQPRSALGQIAGNIAGAAARGVSNLVGLPGDIAQGLDRVTDWAGQQITGNPEWRMRPAPPPEYANLPTRLYPTSSDARDVAREAGIPVDQRAETAGGRIVQDAVEGALSLPGNLPAMAYGALSGGAGGAAAEAAGALGAGETGQTVARVAGGVIAPLAAGRVQSALSRPASTAPTAESLRAQSTAAYERAHNAGVQIAPASTQTFADDLAQSLRTDGFNARLHPRAAAALDEITEAAAAGQPLDLKQVDVLRRIASAAGKSIEPDERRVASLIIDKLDDWVNGLKPADLLAGDAPAATAALNEARGLWGQARRGEIVEGLIERAKERAAQFSGSGLENALRTEFRQFAMNEKRMRGFSAQERAAIQAVSRGGPVVNILRGLGKLAPTGVVSTALGGGIGHAVGGPIGMVAAPIAGIAARASATRMTENAARRASEVARGGTTLPASTGQAISEAIALLTAEREAARWGEPASGAAQTPPTAR